MSSVCSFTSPYLQLREAMVHHKILSTTSNSPANAVWTTYGAVEIRAPAAQVWTAVMDFASCNTWNTWTPCFEPSSGTDAVEVGDICQQRYRIEEVKGNTVKKSKTTLLSVRIMEISDEGMYVCWRGCPEGIPAALLRPERVQRVTRTGENSCLYETWETQAGPMAYLVKWKVASKLDAMMQGIANQLKEYMEGSMETVIAYSAAKQ